MATRKIKDAKDTTTNEVIYFKGHAKATYMSDGRSVEDAIYSIGSSGGEGGITQESDPLFRASAAAGITSSDIAAWNGKMDKVTLASVATSGNYNDLSNKPTIPTTLSQLTQSASYRTVTDTEKNTWGGKQDKLVSGTNLKTINGESLLGSGDIAISGGGISQETDPIFSASPAASITEEKKSEWDSKQDAINDIATIRENASSAFKGTINGHNNGTLWLVEKVNGQTADSTGNVSVPVAYPKVAHGTNDTNFTLTPNVFHVWGGMETLTLTLGAETDGVANEYLFQFTGGSGGTTLVLPDSVKWADGAAPTIEAFKTYQVSILENCATYLCFE